MKDALIPVLLLMTCISASAQITITQADMPHPGGTYITTGLVLDLAIDPVETGPDHIWDFQQLTPLTSTTDTFYDQTELSFLYQLLYTGANLVDKTAYSISIDQLSLDDVYLIYKSNSTLYEQYGFAGTFDGIPVPIVYGEKDVIYNFPLQYGDVDSSESGFAFGLTGFGYVSQQRKRVNTVDGWGTVKTPAGTFNALRVSSTILDVDSVYLDTLNFGTNVTLKSYEYKWLAAGSGTPVFQINAQDVLGLPVVTQITYQDTTLQTGIRPVATSGISLASVFPNPANDMLQIKTNETVDGPLHLTVTNLSGKIIAKRILSHPVSVLDLSSWSNGIYFLEFVENQNVQHHAIVVEH
ncbi:MAG: T9SS type A sorting domain-containing protein [Chitinophagaceae bacterium]|nr:T9SS type A sorting domain-containing protein [Chitinophagaceae bacterium]